MLYAIIKKAKCSVDGSHATNVNAFFQNRYHNINSVYRELEYKTKIVWRGCGCVGEVVEVEDGG